MPSWLVCRCFFLELFC